jgi:hypothetical protein
MELPDYPYDRAKILPFDNGIDHLHLAGGTYTIATCFTIIYSYC